MDPGKAQAFLGVSTPGSPLSSETRVASPEEIERTKAAFLVMAKTEPVLRKTIEDPRVSATTWYRNNVADIYRALDDRLSACSVPGTNLLCFSMTGGGVSPFELAEITTAWADAFVKDVSDNANSDRQTQIQDLTNQMNGLKGVLAEIERDLKTLPDTDERIILQKLTLRTQELQTLAAELMKVQLAVEVAPQQKKMHDEMVARGEVDKEGNGYARQLAMVQAEAVALQGRMDDVGRTVKVLSDALKTATELGAKKRSVQVNIDMLEKRLLELRLLQRGERPVYVRRAASKPR
jgi:archaellum component FlaC